MTRTHWIAVAIAVGLMGCGSHDEEQTETPAAESPPAETAAEATAESTEEAAEPAAEEAAEPAAEEAAEEAAEPAAAGAEGDGPPCEQAFASVQALRQQLEERMGGNNQAPPIDHDDFVEKCNSLPEAARPCAILSYNAEHQQECAQYREQLQALSNN